MRYSISVKEYSQNQASGRSHRVGIQFVKWAIQTLWERGSKSAVRNKDLRPCASVHIDANVVPKDILSQLDDAMASKIFFIYTGPTQLEHEDEVSIIDELMEDAEKLHKYLPVLLSLGVRTLLLRVTKQQMLEMADALSDPNDKRQAQVLYQYDLGIVFMFCDIWPS